MLPQSLSLAVMCVLSIWTIAAGCGERQHEADGQCCDLCLPGTHRNGFCKEQKYDCSPCREGYFSDEYNLFDRCEKCRSCQQDYAEKCTPTTNAKCLCHSGFLCSDNVCSKCEKNKCVMGEKLNRTDYTMGDGGIQYLYTCEPWPSCPDNTYFDVKEDLCKMDREGIDFIQLIFGIGFVLLSLTLLVLLSYFCIKNLRKRKEYNNPMEVLALSINASDFHLSKEESGLELIVQDESKNSNSLGFLHL